MSQWVRLWEDMPTDPKWRVVAKRSGRPVSEVIAVFVMMMTNAGSSENRGELSGWDDEDAAMALDMEPEHVAAIRSAMQGKTLDGEKLTGWERRQPKREDHSTDRVKAFRERQADVKRDETHGNARPENETQRNAPEKRRGDTEEIREDRKPLSLSRPDTTKLLKPEKKEEITDIFEELLSVFPRSGHHSQTKVLQALQATAQAEWPKVVEGARTYAAEFKAKPTDYPMTLDKFISERKWANYGGKSTGPPRLVVEVGTPEWEARVRAGHSPSLRTQVQINGRVTEGWTFAVEPPKERKAS